MCQWLHQDQGACIYVSWIHASCIHTSDLWRVITALVESRVLFLARKSGKPVTDGWRSVILGQFRRYLSSWFVKVQAACLTARLGHLGPSAREVAGRRRDLMAQEERARRGATAYHAAYVRGRGMRRRGTAARLSIFHHILLLESPCSSVRWSGTKFAAS